MMVLLTDDTYVFVTEDRDLLVAVVDHTASVGDKGLILVQEDPLTMPQSS